MGDAFGDLRSLIQASPRALKEWSQLLYIVMRQEGGDLEAAVDYLLQHIKGLPEEERARAVLFRDDTLMERAMAGEDHPALSLIHDVQLYRRAPIEGFEELFSCSRLCNVERYTLNTVQPMPAAHWEWLAMSPHWSGLRALHAEHQRLDRAVVHALLDSGTLAGLRDLSFLHSRLDDEGAALLFADDTLPALRRLDVTGSQSNDPTLFTTLSRWGHDALEHLAIDTTGSEISSPKLLMSDVTASLRSLVVHYPHNGDVQAMVKGPALDRLAELELFITSAPAKKLWDDPRMRTLERLAIHVEDYVPPRRLAWAFKDSVTARSVRHVKLSGWGVDWDVLLKGAHMPHLRTLDLDVPWDDPFPLDEVFPALETSVHTHWDGHYHKEFTYGR